MYWLKSDQVLSMGELAEEYLKDKNTFAFNQELNAIIDTRTHKWYGYPLGSLIDPLIERRAYLKTLKDEFSYSTQESVKFIINTLWGLLTSPYFDLNNVVCSEYVTTSIRSSVWLMSKALNTNISITDGGPYSLMNVSYLDSTKRKPGLNALSTYALYKSHRAITRAPLKGIEWDKLFKANFIQRASIYRIT